MKTQPRLNLAVGSRDEGDLWDQFRNDHELISRLRITPNELDTLAHCALLGTLTCKQDFLFILRQIREATGPITAEELVQLRPVAEPETLFEEEERVLPVIRTHTRVAPAAPWLIERGSLEGLATRRLPAQLGIPFWVLVLAGGLMWNSAIAIWRWRELGAPVPASLPSVSWLASLDDFSVLIGWEILFVGCVVAGVGLRSLTRHRRLKIRPS